MSVHAQWSTRLAFMLAAIGSAVGLGNVWKFPYITGENGGGAFVLVYLLCIALIGIPVMIAEVMLGRRAQRSPISTMQVLAKEQGASGFWQIIGWSGVFAGFLILSFYSVIAGWAMAYVIESASGTFNAISGDGSGDVFGGLIGDPQRLMIWHTLFMIMTVAVVARGVRAGIEKLVVILMPLLLVMLLILVAYAFNSGEFGRGLAYLFSFDFSKLSTDSIIVAMGHAFFTLSLGMGAIMVYGSYMQKNTSIGSSVLMIAIADTVVALLAGLAIFPLVFANGLEPGAGPGLVFVTLPTAFGAMPGGQFFGTVFFVLLVIAAWSSAISLVEPVVAWLSERDIISRAKASWMIGLFSWILGTGTVLSFNLWSGDEYKVMGKTFFDLKDYLASNIMLPLGGLLIALFVGWAAKASMSKDELNLSSGTFSLFWLAIRFVAPLGVAIIFLNAVGLL